MTDSSAVPATTDRHTPYCPLSRPVLERGTPPGYDPNELPIQCTCNAEGADHD